VETFMVMSIYSTWVNFRVNSRRGKIHSKINQCLTKNNRIVIVDHRSDTIEC